MLSSRVTGVSKGNKTDDEKELLAHQRRGESTSAKATETMTGSFTPVLLRLCHTLGRRDNLTFHWQRNEPIVSLSRWTEDILRFNSSHWILLFGAPIWTRYLKEKCNDEPTMHRKWINCSRSMIIFLYFSNKHCNSMRCVWKAMKAKQTLSWVSEETRIDHRFLYSGGSSFGAWHSCRFSSSLSKCQYCIAGRKQRGMCGHIPSLSIRIRSVDD